MRCILYIVPSLSGSPLEHGIFVPCTYYIPYPCTTLYMTHIQLAVGASPSSLSLCGASASARTPRTSTTGLASLSSQGLAYIHYSTISIFNYLPFQYYTVSLYQYIRIVSRLVRVTYFQLDLRVYLLNPLRSLSKAFYPGRVKRCTLAITTSSLLP